MTRGRGGRAMAAAVLFTLAVTATPACTLSPAPVTVGEGPRTPVAVPTLAPLNHPPACSLVTPVELDVILERHVSAIPHDLTSGAMAACGYRTVEGDAFAAVGIAVGPPGVKMFHESPRARATVAVDGLGDRADFDGYSLRLLRGDVYIRVDAWRVPAPSGTTLLRIERAIASKALSRVHRPRRARTA